MPALEPSRSAPVTIAQSIPILSSLTRSHSSRPPKLSRVLAAQHLDDVSNYHSDDHGPQSYGEDTSTEGSDASEKVRQEDYEEARGRGQEQVPEVRMGVRDTGDLEANNLEKKQSTKSIQDPNLVTQNLAFYALANKVADILQVSWDGPDDPANPKNWSLGMKWVATVVVSSFTFISPVSSSMVAPALPSIARDFGISSEVESQLVLSIFVLAYAIGPFFFGPLSEIYGRVPVLQISNVFYLVFNIACGASKTKGQMITFRFLAGIGGSAPLSVSAKETWSGTDC